MAISEQEFLAQIARRQGRSLVETPPPRPGHVRGLRPQPPSMSSREAMAQWFCRELTRLNTVAELTPDLHSAGVAAAATIAEATPGRGLVVLADDHNALAASQPLTGHGFNVRVWPIDRVTCAAALAGVTSADVAIAETGSLALASSERTGRSISLLPPIHVAIVPTSRLVATVGEYFHWLGTRVNEMPAAVELITGPSRTADIEFELSVGVHGPSAIYVFLYHDSV
jgi:L-lactate dehydrogenase complex protein LldG